MNPYTVVSVMLGMNRFHQKDADHPFDMSALDGYNTIWMPELDEEERKCSTLFYEALQGVESARKATLSEIKDNFIFIFGRGTIGPSQEERLFEAWHSCMKYYGNDVNHVMIGKSFGAGDTMTALHKFKIYHRKPNVRRLILIDGFLPPSRRRKIGKKVGKTWRFKIPPFVQNYNNIIQRTRGIQGARVVDNDANFVVTQDYLKKTMDNPVYFGYSDGYVRELEVRHFNMEEIVSAAKCIDVHGVKMILREAVAQTLFQIERTAGVR
ncbi:MAG: hypothetical protein DRP09_10265 [Candidatus Thorarchaeota archaeon]|nr:MAG: hypothetical protein DRP09_10265 [Candidatus Thorarchaeota archaeon]